VQPLQFHYSLDKNLGTFVALTFPENVSTRTADVRAMDLKTHKLYTPEQEEDGKPVARIIVYQALGDR